LLLFKTTKTVSWSSDKTICWTLLSLILILIWFWSLTELTFDFFASSEVNCWIQSLMEMYIKPSWLPMIKNPYLLEIANNEMYGFNSSSSNGSVIERVVFEVSWVSLRNYGCMNNLFIFIINVFIFNIYIKISILKRFTFEINFHNIN